MALYLKRGIQSIKPQITDLLDNNNEPLNASIGLDTVDKSIPYFTNRNRFSSSLKSQFNGGFHRAEKENGDNEEFSLEDSKDRVGLDKDINSKKKTITLKCFNCGENGHFAKQCPLSANQLKYNGNHNDHSLKKCMKCTSNCHLASECGVLQSKENCCSRCKENGHKANECLINPIQGIKVKCLFCKSNDHLICPFPLDNKFDIEDYHSDEVDVSDSDLEEPDDFFAILSFFTKEISRSRPNSRHPNFLHQKRALPSQRLFNSISNEAIQKTIFCEKCGGMHKSSKCLQSKRSTPKPPLQLKPTLHHMKNPLKFQPMNPRTEFSINHHLPYKNYYEDENSSGDSFREIVKDHLSKYNKK